MNKTLVNLHSTVVLLKDENELVLDNCIGRFTFYCSSIKSEDRLKRYLDLIEFTFYCSSIKSNLKDKLHDTNCLIYILL